jgi:poly(A) polymerase Pap1
MQDDFFMELCLILMGKEEVTELYPVPNSHVPVMKFKFNEVSIDLVYARFSLWVILNASVCFFVNNHWKHVFFGHWL